MLNDFIIRLLFSITVLLLMASIPAMLFRNKSAATRHRVWSCAVLGILLLPGLVVFLPQKPIATTTVQTPVGKEVVLDRGDAPNDSRSRREGGVSEIVRPVGHRDITNDSEPMAAIDGMATFNATVALSYGSEMRRPAENSPQFFISFLHTLFLVWFFGTISLLFRLAGSLLSLYRMQKRLLPLQDTSVERIATEIAAKLKIRRPVRYFQSEVGLIPFTVGVFQPRVVVPSEFFDWNESRRREVLTHELGHVARHDVFWQILCKIVFALYWFHPLVWLATWRMRVERELACDDLVLLHGALPSDYASILLELADKLTDRSRDHVLGCTVAMARRNAVRKRIAAILNPATRRKPLGKIGSASLLFFSVVGISVAALLGPPEERGVDQTEPAKPTATENPAESPSVPPLSLSVLDPDGKPMPHVEVEVRMSPQPEEWTTIPELFVRKHRYGVVLKTDETGAVPIRLADRKINSLQCFVRTDGYTPFCAQWKDVIPASYSMKLDKAATVAALFVNEKDEPLEGVVLDPSVEYKKREDDLSQLGMGGTFKSDKDGNWIFASAPIPPGYLWVEISHPDYMPVGMRLPLEEYGLDPNGKPTKKIVLNAGNSISGTITDKDGKPVAEAKLRARFLNMEREAKADENGHYRFTAIPEGKHRFFASGKGHAPEERSIEVTKDSPKERTEINFKLEPGGTIKVVVTEKDGTPIPETRIFFQRWHGRFSDLEENYGLGGMYHHYTDENGVWTWHEAPPDGVYFDICAPGKMQVGDQLLVPRAEEYRFTPSPELVVTGRVVDAETGEPVKKMTVMPGWFGDERYDTAPHWDIGGRYESVDGKYRFATTSSRDAHGFRIEADGYLPFESRRILGDEGAVTMDIKLQKGRNIAATVVDAGGKPVGDADVLLGIRGSQIMISNGKPNQSTFCERAKTDKEGKFHLAPQKDGYELIVLHDSGVAWVFCEPDTSPQTITLEPWAKIEGELKLGDLESNVPKTDAKIATLYMTMRSRPGKERYQDQDSLANTRFDASVQVNSDGKFAFDKVLPGPVSIGRQVSYAVTRTMRTLTLSHTKRLDLKPGETAKVVIGGGGRTVTGKLNMADRKPDWNFCVVQMYQKQRPRIPQLPDDIKALIPENILAEKDDAKRQALYKAWYETETGKKYRELSTAFYITMEKALMAAPPDLPREKYACPVAEDGTFRMEAVTPGEWTLSVSLDENYQDTKRDGTLTKEISVPETPTNEPLDLGELDVKAVE